MLTDELAGTDGERFAFLERPVAGVAQEAVQMVDEMFRSHHHLARRDTFATAVTVALVLLLLLLLAMLLVVLLVLLMHG